MRTTQRFPLLVSALAAALVLLAILAIALLYRGAPDLLTFAALSDARITPNADGVQDATAVSYGLSRNAIVSIYFEHQGTGERHYFRRNQLRSVGEYRVLFSGVVEGYRLPGEAVEGEVLARLLQNGDYTWVIEATTADGQTMQRSGALTVADATTELPDLRGFAIAPTSFDPAWTGAPGEPIRFSPNRDGIADRLQIQFDLARDVTVLRVFLLTADGLEYPAFEVPRDVPPNLAGLHIFDYAGGVDQGAPPPPDGLYQMVALAEDAEGQRVRAQGLVEIIYGGVPRAEIISPVSAPTLQFSASAVRLCETLAFTVTIANYGDTPIRTTGPAPGFVYDSDWNYNTIGRPTESGAWRVGIGYENELKDYGYRWAVAAPERLTRIGSFDYLMPGEQAVVTGGIRIVGPLGERNPQPMWVGLIHEDVEISQFNNRRDPRAITIDLPAAGDGATCPPRDPR